MQIYSCPDPNPNPSIRICGRDAHYGNGIAVASLSSETIFQAFCGCNIALFALFKLMKV